MGERVGRVRGKGASMTGPGSRQVTLLVVDDDSFLATTLAFALQRTFPPQTSVRTSASFAESLRLVDAESFDAVIADDHLPDGRGSEILKHLLSRGGRVPILFLISGRNPDELDVGSLLRQYPQITFIEKPFLFHEVARQIRASVLPQVTTEPHHYGLQLFDLIQAYGLARRSATLRVLLEDGRMGTVAIREGDLIHAVMGSLIGTEALLEIARNKKGHIRIEEACTTARQTIYLPTEYVLLDTFRMLDERREAGTSGDELAPSPHPQS